jgi:hypothetical protein
MLGRVGQECNLTSRGASECQCAAAALLGWVAFFTDGWIHHRHRRMLLCLVCTWARPHPAMICKQGSGGKVRATCRGLCALVAPACSCEQSFSYLACGQRQAQARWPCLPQRVAAPSGRLPAAVGPPFICCRMRSPGWVHRDGRWCCRSGLVLPAQAGLSLARTESLLRRRAPRAHQRSRHLCLTMP